MDIHLFWDGPVKLKDLDKLEDEDRDYGVY